jgi:hypothetical protein
MHAEATKHVLLGCQSLGCPAAISRSGRNDRGGEQTWGPEHKEMAAVSKKRSVMKSFRREYLIKYFADSAGKKGGQFYTPPHVVRLMVQLLRPSEGMSIYDPTVGSAGMLIQSSQHVSEQGGDGENLELHGQENDGAVVSIAKMNLILHNLKSGHIEYVGMGAVTEEDNKKK